MSPFEQIKSRELHEADLKSKIDNLLIRSQRVMSKEERGCHLQADFTTFPSKSFTQVCNFLISSQKAVISSNTENEIIKTRFGRKAVPQSAAWSKFEQIAFKFITISTIE